MVIYAAYFSVNLPGEFGQSTLVIDDDEAHHEGVIETDNVYDWVQS
jgi:hypothetical protein